MDPYFSLVFRAQFVWFTTQFFALRNPKTILANAAAAASNSQEGRKFRLSHRAPVDLPLETSASLDAQFLNRSSVTNHQPNQQKLWGFHDRFLVAKMVVTI